MNEQIKELADLSKLTGKGDLSETQIGIELGIAVEKFAELIVKECASKVDWILAAGGKTQGDLIKEHFGVKE